MRFDVCALTMLLASLTPATLPRAAQLSVAQPGVTQPGVAVDDHQPLAMQEVQTRLGRGSFEQRQQAMWALWRERARSGDAIRAAVSDDDPEVAGRARWILNRWKRGILPELPTPLGQQVATLTPAGAFRYLLAAGQFAPAVVAADEALTAEDHDCLAELVTELQAAFPFYVRLAVESGQRDQLLELVGRLRLTAEMLVCHDQLSRRLVDHGAVSADSLPGFDGNPSVWLGISEPAAADVLVHASRGDWDTVQQGVQALGDHRLWRASRLLQRDWAALAAAESESAQAAVSASAAAVEHWAYALIAADRCGDRELREQAVAALTQPLAEASLGPAIGGGATELASALQWRVLAMHGEIDAAVALLRDSQPMDAVELLAQSGRVAEAFATAGIDPASIDGQWSAIVQTAIDQAQSWPVGSAQQTPESLERALTVARLLYLTGRRDLAWEMYRQLADASLADSRLVWVQGHVLQALYRITRVDWITRVMISSGMQVNAGMGRHLLAHVFDVSPETVGAIAHGLAVTMPADDQTLVQNLAGYLSGEVPEGFQPETDHRRMFESLSQMAQQAQIPAVGTVMTPRARVGRLTLPLARLFETHNQFLLAQETRLELASLGQVEAILELAEAELRSGQLQSAKSLFETTWKRLLAQLQAAGGFDVSASSELLLRVVLGEAVTAAAAGDAVAAAEHWQTLDLIACTPSSELRNTLGQLLLDERYSDRAAAVLEPLLPMLLFSDEHRPRFYTAARRLGQAMEPTDPLGAADTFDLALMASVGSTAFYPGGYVLFPAIVKRGRILAVIEQGDETAVSEAVSDLLRLMPIDINFAEDAIKKMRQQGMHELADQTIARVHQAGWKHMQQFPRDSLMGNNLAWVMALSDYRLDQALELSERTVLHYPDSTVYRDTLAEILFRLGRIDEAILLIEACLRDSPGEWHSHEQLQRFRKALINEP